MRLPQLYRKFTFSLCLTFLFVISTQTSYAQELKVGYSSDKPPYQYTNKQGKADGLIIDFWRLWSKKTNTPINFIATTSDNAIFSLKKEDFAVHAGIYMDKSNDPSLHQGQIFCTSNAIIFTDIDIKYNGSLEELNAHRVGVILEEINTRKHLENYLQPESIVPFKNYQQLMDAVSKGHIKVFAADALSAFYHLNQAGTLNSFYYNRSESLFTSEWKITTIDANKDIQNIIKSGMDLVSESEKIAIIRRWSSGIPHEVTDAIVIATPIKYPPLSVIGTDGKARGYLIDLWQEWGRQVNKEIQFRGSVWSETLRGIKTGEADIHSGLFKNEERQTWLDFSSPFLVAETAIFYKIDQAKFPSLNKLAGKAVGVIQGTYQANFLKKHYPDIQTIEFSDMDRMFIALFQNKIVAIVAEEPEVIGTLNKLGLTGAIQKGEKLFQNDIYAGVLKGNKEMLALVEKGFNAIPEATKKEILERYFPPDNKFAKILLWAGLFIIVLVFGIIFIGINNKILNRKVKVRTARLEDSENQLQMILNNSPLGILIADTETLHLKYANPAVCKILGYNKNELESLSVDSLHTPEDFKQVSLVFKAQAKGNKKIGTDIPFLRKDKTIIVADMISASSELNNRPCLTGFLVDRTETKQLGMQLAQAQKMEAIGMMAGGVAHDLNNILSGIVSYPELLLMQLPESSELREPLEAIHDSGKRAAMVVADLLTIAKGAASTREPHDANVLIKEYFNSPECKKLKSLHPGVSYTEELDAEQSIVSCSPMHIKKIIMNLMANAVESIIDKGCVFVSTCNRQIDSSEALVLNMKPGAYILVTIKDNGLGIADKDLEHIFEPFYTKKVMGQGGTGLGLAIVWNTVQDHNGKIVVKSSTKGTCFQIYFPVSKNKAAIQIEHDKTENLTGNNEHILVVDDEPHLQNITNQILTSLDYSVDMVSSGELAIDFVKNTPVDLIVMDMLMEPGLNGRQTYEEIIKLYPGQKAIIASGFSESDDVKAAIKLGVAAFIKKPYSMDQLGRAIKEALEN